MDPSTLAAVLKDGKLRHGTATEDYLPRAIGGPAFGYGLNTDPFHGPLAAISRPADSTRQVVFRSFFV
jgi:hypothetical protein